MTPLGGVLMLSVWALLLTLSLWADWWLHARRCRRGTR